MQYRVLAVEKVLKVSTRVFGRWTFKKELIPIRYRIPQKIVLICDGDKFKLEHEDMGTPLYMGTIVSRKKGFLSGVTTLEARSDRDRLRIRCEPIDAPAKVRKPTWRKRFLAAVAG